MMDETIDGRERHGLVREDLAPFAERLVGRDQHGSPFITRGDQLEQHARFGLILGDVGEVIEDEQIWRFFDRDGGKQDFAAELLSLVAGYGRLKLDQAKGCRSGARESPAQAALFRSAIFLSDAVVALLTIEVCQRGLDLRGN
jgi:hypothetical protein